jgi:phosphoglycerol transferase MdoB-like AlkP superfamily enzyme
MPGAAYSVWTNHSFKWPILAGACTCLISNVLYVLSYDLRALWLLILSRFVMGFGAHAAPCCLYVLRTKHPAAPTHTGNLGLSIACVMCIWMRYFC